MGSYLEMKPSPSQEPADKKEKKWRRPYLLLGLILGFLLLSVYGWLRFQQSLALWEVLQEIGIEPGPLYLAVSGAVWGIIGLAVGLGLFFRQAWAAGLARAAVVVLAAWYWFDRLVLIRSEAAQASAPFAALLTVFVVAYTFGVLKFVERAKRAGQPRREDRSQEG
jgi:hypothetical protein